MRCDEFRKTMQLFLDGEVDKKIRKEWGLHLIECPDCERLVDDTETWTKLVQNTLARKAPDELRSALLGEDVTGRPRPSRKKEWAAIWRYVKADLTPRSWAIDALFFAAIFAVIFWLIPKVSSEYTAFMAFKKAGPAVCVEESKDREVPDHLSVGVFEFSGRFF